MRRGTIYINFPDNKIAKNPVALYRFSSNGESHSYNGYGFEALPMLLKEVFSDMKDILQKLD